MRKNLKHTIKGVLNEIKENLYFIPENDENQVLDTLKSDVEDKVKKAYEKVTGKELNLPKFKIKVDNKIKDGKIAGMVHPDDDGNGGHEKDSHEGVAVITSIKKMMVIMMVMRMTVMMVSQ